LRGQESIKERFMTRTTIAFLSTVMLASTALLASVPNAYPGKFQVAKGKTVYVSLASEADGKTTPTFYKSQPKTGPFISFALSELTGGNPEMGGPTVLVVTNTYDKALSYKARECFSGERLCQISTVAPVKAGSMHNKSWGRSLYAIEVTALTLE
jgi:hypothetical protein